MYRRTAVIAVAACLTSIALAAQAMSGGGGHIEVEASASPALGRFSFESNDLKVTEADGKLVFVTNLGGMKMGLRKGHTHEAFEVPKHPNAKLTVDKAKLKIPTSGTEKGNVPGELTLHGVTRPVNVKYTVTAEGSGYKVGGSFSFKYEDFKVSKICKVGVCVDPEVKVSVSDVKVKGG